MLNTEVEKVLRGIMRQTRVLQSPWMVQKLTAEELEEQARREKAASAQGVSVWNQVLLCHAPTSSAFDLP